MNRWSGADDRGCHHRRLRANPPFALQTTRVAMRHVCATTVWFAALSLAADGLPHVEGTLSVPSVISDDMVLPAHPRHAVLWGWGRPHSPVSVAVTGPGLREQGNTTAGASGAWRVGLPPLSPSLAPNVITVTSPGETPLVFRRVLVGDLVLCGGQRWVSGTRVRSLCQLRCLTVPVVLALWLSALPARPPACLSHWQQQLSQPSHHPRVLLTR